MGLGPAKSTLWSWSKAMWSDPMQWPHVYEGCQDRIGEDPRAMPPRNDLHTCTLVPRIGKRKTVTVATTVKKGDCLWGISRQLTGTGTNWKACGASADSWLHGHQLERRLFGCFSICPFSHSRDPPSSPPSHIILLRHLLSAPDIVNENRHYFKKAKFDTPIDDDLFIIQPGWKLKMPVTAPPPPED
ncbi:unnamed protein product [Closterium sp. NIES-65]|nr:unnamed protein product [Closterium sp. NIES-65]